ncbi:DUF4199 domain-containing protein [Acinetobacter sp. RIT698]|uniref:DUF4199 domain-containing protein n=2 Tax=Acinetobacter guillouiae TaxID=106649 RepID=N8WRT9_ACIGI|nr:MULTISPECIES: hypothetical protein [Acinetobacter]ENV14847.1 hypothetical protein F964_04591 [Acinetobacter guillouiae NIPH 991]MCF0266660.1 DUF4199 domain-containing protein [Acinetobacter guillouiae]MCS4300227.1 hypothetical protein [Acinetobacter guillouiae]MCW2253567.1 hypothetical protein [Acinetobacter sp. BIGb0204]MDI1221982.1 DUF4199 domain-containing protein [Acinetobacter sp.]
MSNDSNKLSPEKSFWGWKLLIIAIILSCIFMGIFYLAITNEPDYMPSQKQNAAQQHDMSKMSHESMPNMDQPASEATHSH